MEKQYNHDANLVLPRFKEGLVVLGRTTQPATSSAALRLDDSMSPHHTNPLQVMSPNLDRTQPQNPSIRA